LFYIYIFFLSKKKKKQFEGSEVANVGKINVIGFVNGISITKRMHIGSVQLSSSSSSSGGGGHFAVVALGQEHRLGRWYISICFIFFCFF
jgi:hypothetical protein